LGKAANDSERGAIFDAQAANLRDQGIDLKDLIAADQARHLALNSDATLKSNLAMNDSNLASNVLEQAGLGIENKTNQGALDNQLQVQGDAHNSALQNILESNFTIEANKSSNALRQLQAGEIGAARKLLAEEKAATNTGMAAYLKESQDLGNFTNGVPDRAKIIAKLSSLGVSPDIMLKGFAAEKTFGGAEAIAEEAKIATANKEKRDFAAVEQALADASKGRTDARDALKAAQDTDTWWGSGNFGQDNEKVAGDAAISGAFATIVKDPSGKDVSFSPSDISRWATEHSDNGDLRVDEFNKRLRMEATAINTGVPVEDAVDKIKKSLTTQQLMNGKN
jgi:hypothetical protein